MEKVILGKRAIKEIRLPETGLEISCYPSLLVGDLLKIDPNADGIEASLQALIPVIVSWNLYDNEQAEKPAEITIENLKRIPSPDFHFLVNELKLFADSQKKS